MTDTRPKRVWVIEWTDPLGDRQQEVWTTSSLVHQRRGILLASGIPRTTIHPRIVHDERSLDALQ